MGDWTPQIVDFMVDATEQTDYFKKLAAIIREEVVLGGCICDAGCGLGQLSFELAPYVRYVDAVDRSLNAVALAGHEALFGGYGNVLVRYGDFDQQLFPVSYDCMIFSLSASFDDAYAIAKRAGAKRLVVVNKVHKSIEQDRSKTDILPYRRSNRPMVYDFSETVANLRHRGFAVRASRATLDFGQPLRSLEAAREFILLYRSDKYPDGIEDDELEGLLDRRDSAEFPYYLPMTRHLAVFALDIE